jgi:DNA-binding transcriptional regulator PaaX
MRYLDENNISTKDIILSVVAFAGILAVGAVAPNTIQLLKDNKLFKKNYHKPSYINKRLNSLKIQGLIEQTADGHIRLSARGERELERLKAIGSQDKERKKWDGKWFVLSFDIKEKRRKQRDLLRQELRNFGFIRVQHSVWVYPFNCADFITLLKADLTLGRGIRCFKAEMLDSDVELCELFGLEHKN